MEKTTGIDIQITQNLVSVHGPQSCWVKICVRNFWSNAADKPVSIEMLMQLHYFRMSVSWSVNIVGEGNGNSVL